MAIFLTSIKGTTIERPRTIFHTETLNLLTYSKTASEVTQTPISS